MLKDPTGDRFSPYYDENGTFLGLDEYGWKGNIYITTKEAFDRSATNGIANSKILQANQATKLISAFASLSDKALARIFTSILSETGFADLSKLHNGSISVYNGRSINSVFQGYNNPLNAGRGKTDNTNFGGKINVTVNSNVRTELNTVESVQSYLGIHEYKGHGILNYDGGFAPGGNHYKAWEMQYRDKTFNSLSEYHKADIINNTINYMYQENRGAYNRHESSNSNLFQLYRKYR
jgi:hypothetical protein